MKHRVAPFLENIAESTTACLVTMVQGNLLTLSMTHWWIASRTGLIAGTVASAALLVARNKSRWQMAATLGAATALVDYFMHPGQFGPPGLEALVTGVGAATLSFLAGIVVQRVRDRRASVA